MLESLKQFGISSYKISFSFYRVSRMQDWFCDCREHCQTRILLEYLLQLNSRQQYLTEYLLLYVLTLQLSTRLSLLMFFLSGFFLSSVALRD